MTNTTADKKNAALPKKATSVKIPKGSVMAPTALQVDPGQGAVNFAKRYISEMTLFHVSEVCEGLVAGSFEGVDDKKVRRCQYCGYYYECPTKNNSSLTCSDECKRGKDIELKDFRRVHNGKPKRATYRDLYYTEYNSDTGEKLEYPYWRSEFHMFENDRKRDTYAHGDDFEDVVASDMMRRQMGGKKKVGQIIEFDGDRKHTPIAVDLSMERRLTDEKVEYYSSREDIEAGFLERYGERHLKEERKRSIIRGKYGNL